MNQFKDLFLGVREPIFTRVADTQKCLRVSGKHNDLEEVGVDTYHHTFFEMLGNWSFGDYFKEEAISMAWDLLTRVYKLSADDLYVTVFEGNAEDKMEMDTEAFEIWTRFIDTQKIIKGNKKDNFWEMGTTGPCGPCSEIHVDLRSATEKKAVSGQKLVNQGHPQVVEIWNLVFIQYNRTSSGFLEALPAKHVDTGMGFERLCMAIQKKSSNYDTDLFQPLIQKIAQEAKKEYGKSEKIDIAIRVIADHIRAIAFTIADGQLPSNTGAGYVIRRILRRAVRYGYTYLDFRKPFLIPLLDILAIQFENIFPEIKSQQAFISNVIQEEELGFLKTLEAGINRFEKYKTSTNLVDGEFAFELFDTFGFPLDLTVLMAKEKGWRVDLEVFDKELENQRIRARSSNLSTIEDWVEMPSSEKNSLDTHSVFIGYDTLESSSSIIRYREIKNKDQVQFQWVFNKTPFYPEGGGQVGDKGYMFFENESLEIINTRKENNQIFHITNQFPSQIKWISKEVKLQVDKTRRKSISRNHSVTHLLQASLKQVLGPHIAQKGSLVEEDHLRFDFSHFAKLTKEELEKVEKLVNQKILENIVLEEQRNIPFVKAIEMGATALFGEKYGDSVRMITFDPAFSRELCGGTHIKATGEIGLFEIENEVTVGTGIRRISAITGEYALEEFKKRKNILNQFESLLKPNGDILLALTSLLQENQNLLKEKEKARILACKELKEKIRKVILSRTKNEFENSALNKNSSEILVSERLSNLSSDLLKTLSFELLDEFKGIKLGLVFGLEIERKPFLAIGLSRAYLEKNPTFKASGIVEQVSFLIEGGGGGQPGYATAGGKNLEGLEKAMETAIELLSHTA